MKITFGQQSIIDTEKKSTERKVLPGAENNAVNKAAYASFALSRTDIFSANTVEKGKSLIEIQQNAGNVNVDVMQDYMTLAANTLSEEDYASMQKEGFDFGSMDPEEACTIVDKIKAELARSGQHIPGYTDDLDLGTLAEALGSESLAAAVENSFAKANLPLSAENVSDVAQAWNMAGQLHVLQDGSYEYLIDNGMEPEIWNLYLAQNSGAGKGNGAPGFYQENVHGYFSKLATGNARSEVAVQIDRMIEESGRELSRENREKASWLLEKGLLLTGENMHRLEQLQNIAVPVTEELFATAVATAVADGQKPIHANLAADKNVYERAAEAFRYYQGEEIWMATSDNVTARRQLEEIRLRMTAEVNVKLLKSGFAIDTAPMEQLVEALKEAEEQLAKQYFPKDGDAVEKFRNLQQTNTVVAQLPGLPATVLGMFVDEESEVSVGKLHGRGVQLRDTYEKAQSSYEALMTTPRADLGDSIRKAFANVDDILQDLGYEPSDETRRAVRILGYNNMEITPERIEVIRAADSQVKNVIEKMTPATVLRMIRDGVNPLEQSFEQLEQYFDSIPLDFDKQATEYSRFLLGLEHNQAISADERESYIGIYRLLRQLEKSDGAAVGAVVNVQANLQFSNLLTAVRTMKAKHLDTKVDDQLGVVTELVSKGESISEQIAKAFLRNAKEVVTEVSHAEGVEESYNQEQYESVRRAILAADEECVSMLQRGDLPLSADYLRAGYALMQSKGRAFGKAAKNIQAAVSDRERTEDLVSVGDFLAEEIRDEATQLWETLEDGEGFAKRYKSLMEKTTDAVEEATFAQAGETLDVRQLQLVHKQLAVATALSEAEEYFVPMYIGDELAGVHLTLDRFGSEKGTVRIQVTLPGGENLQAKLYVEENRLNGIFTGETQNEVMKLEKIADIFRKETNERWAVGSIHVVQAGRGNAEIPVAERNKTPNAELYAVAKAFLKSVKQGEEIYEN